MSQIPLPAAVEVLDYLAIRQECLARYAELREEAIEDLNDNDPAVHVLEVLAYREVLLRARINDSVRDTMLASASGQGLDDLGADPLYNNTPRLVLVEGDADSVPPILPVMETDDAYRARLRLAPSEASVAGPSGAYESHARRAHPDVVDVAVTSPDPCDILVEVLHDSEDPDILTTIYEALSHSLVRPIGDRVDVVSATKQASACTLTVYVPDGPDLEAVRAASQANVEALIYPEAAKVRSGAFFSEGDTRSFLGACKVSGVRAWQASSIIGMSNVEAAWWPMTITVVAVRSSAD